MKRILIVGGSTRAAAWSARRAGLQPICADLFADLDTRQIAEVIPVGDYPASLPEDVSHVQADGWFYTGALENHPDLIERLQQGEGSYGPLLGTPADSLRKCRDPFWLVNLLKQARALPLEVRPGSDEPPRDGTWMRKPLASAGGRAITVWNESASIVAGDEPCYFQARLSGVTQSAIYRSNSDQAEFLGLTQQLNGVKRSNAPTVFHYCGSIGPLHQFESKLSRIELDRIANSLVSQCALRGVFGIDFIEDFDGRARVLEVNPRYTASVEIVELAQRRSVLCEHPTVSHGRDVAFPWLAKAILYAMKRLIAPKLEGCCFAQSEWEIPALADIPVPGTTIEPGWPICTVFAAGDTPQTCLNSLTKKADEVWRQLEHCGKP